jgi:hypothetical protein
MSQWQCSYRESGWQSETVNPESKVLGGMPPLAKTGADFHPSVKVMGSFADV